MNKSKVIEYLKINNSGDHPIKLENVDISEKMANDMTLLFVDFVRQLGMPLDNLESVSCRAYPGFSPFSHNKGGIELKAFDYDYINAYYSGTPFPALNEVLENSYKYDLERFLKDNPDYPKDQVKWTDEQSDNFYEAIREQGDGIQYLTRIMYNGKERGIHKATVELFITASDAPYYCGYDILIERNLSFRNLSSLKEKLDKILKQKDVKKFERMISESL